MFVSDRAGGRIRIMCSGLCPEVSAQLNRNSPENLRILLPPASVTADERGSEVEKSYEKNDTDVLRATRWHVRRHRSSKDFQVSAD